MAEEVATNNGPLGMRSEPQPDIGRTQDLEMVATHANVEGLRLPPDLIALAYDRNDGDIVNAIMNLTEPIFRRQLERELAERQAEAAEGQRRYHSMHHPAHWDSAVGGLSDRSYAHQVHHAEEEEEEPPDARELDLVKEIKRNLRTLQEQLDTEMANANNGTVMSEGAYVCMMEAVKKAWESTEKVPA